MSSWVPPRDWIEPTPAQAVAAVSAPAAAVASGPAPASVAVAAGGQAARVLQDAQKAMEDFELSDSDDDAELGIGTAPRTDADDMTAAAAAGNGAVSVPGLAPQQELQPQPDKTYTRRESDVILQEAQNAMKDFELSDSDDDDDDDLDNDPIFSTV